MATEDAVEPEHLDYWSRNDRLYKTLLGFGLWVEPVFVSDSPIAGDIDYLRVSVGQPKATAEGSEAVLYRPSGGCSSN